MNRILRFLRTTIVGGLLFLVPLILLVVLLEKAFQLVRKLFAPIVVQLPKGPLEAAGLAYLLAVVALVLVAFIAGLIARTGFGTWLVEKIESFVLRKVPGFTLLKSMAHGSLGTPTDHEVQVAFANLDDAWVIAFIIEKETNGLLTVFVPSAPTPTAGSLYFLREEQLRRVDVPMSEAIHCLMQLGVGARPLLEHAQLGTGTRSQARTAT